MSSEFKIIDVQKLTKAGMPLLIKASGKEYHESLGPFVRITQGAEDRYIYVLAYFEEGQIEDESSFVPLHRKGFTGSDYPKVILKPSKETTRKYKKALYAVTVIPTEEYKDELDKIDIIVDFHYKDYNEKELGDVGGPNRATVASTPDGQF